MARQLTFDLPVRPALGREDFFVAPANADALAMIDAPARWPFGKLLLTGPRGSGKSHLVEVFAHDRQALIVEGAELSDMGEPPEAVVVENAEGVAGRHEEALFHLHNRLAERSRLLLLTAAEPPARWGLRLPDLLSRMQATAVARLSPPDDTLLAALIVKLFADRQVQVPPALIPYLVSRIDRSFAGARALVAALDARALALGRPITSAMAADLLDSPPPDAS